MADVKHCTLVLSTILKDFFTSFIVESKILRNHWLRNYFDKLVDRGECKIIGTRLTMFSRRIVEFLHKHTCQIFSLLAFGEQWFLSLIMATSFSGGRSRSTWREPPTMGKQLVNYITCGWKYSAPFFCNLQSQAWTHTALVIGLYELLGNPTT